MRAVVYRKPFEVAVEEVPDPRIEQPNDVIVRITSTCICGSDLHMYEGRTAAEPGILFGHENLGIIEEVGRRTPPCCAVRRVSSWSTAYLSGSPRRGRLARSPSTSPGATQVSRSRTRPVARAPTRASTRLVTRRQPLR